MNILIIDNYDSFTFNLYQHIGEIIQKNIKSLFSQVEIEVYRNDQITVQEIENKHIDRIIISPGPGNPKDENYFGVCSQVITKIGRSTPILGVCLGMQGIAHCFGGDVISAPIPVHGKTSSLYHDGKGVFKNIPQKIDIMRYHSLMVDVNNIPECMEISAVVHPESSPKGNFLEIAKEGYEIMGIRHKEYQIEGVQFHPESFATEGSQKMLENFIFQT